MISRQPQLSPDHGPNIGLQVEAFIRALLVRTARPSAGELLRAIERHISPLAKRDFKGAIENIAKDKDLRRADIAYLQAMLADGSLTTALRGEGRADEEIVSSIDALLRQTELYRSSKQFKDMVAFMGRFREYAPYNVMLVRLQDPSCGFFATAVDWWKRHQRRLIGDPKPMLILAPMHPMMVVYALDQTEGRDIPKQLLEFVHFEGEWQPKWLANLGENAVRHGICVVFRELSSTFSGRATNDPGIDGWKMRVTIHNRLDETSQFGVLVHELAHVLLGHLGSDYDHWWPGRFNVDSVSAEIEAEAVVYIVTNRFGLRGESAAYLSGYVADAVIPQGVSIDFIAKVAGVIERMAKGPLPAPKPRLPSGARRRPGYDSAELFDGLD